MFKKYLYSIYFLLIGVVLFAQQDRPERFDSPDENATLAPGGTPIDDYTYVLLGLAIVAIVYIVYRSKQLRKA